MKHENPFNKPGPIDPRPNSELSALDYYEKKVGSDICKKYFLLSPADTEGWRTATIVYNKKSSKRLPKNLAIQFKIKNDLDSDIPYWMAASGSLNGSGLYHEEDNEVYVNNDGNAVIHITDNNGKIEAKVHNVLAIYGHKYEDARVILYKNPKEFDVLATPTV